jgi:hypothetical protein
MDGPNVATQSVADKAGKGAIIHLFSFRGHGDKAKNRTRSSSGVLAVPGVLTCRPLGGRLPVLTPPL